MPPKPWETRKRPTAENISEIIQSNPTMKEDVPKITAEQPMQSPMRSATETSPMTSSTNAYGTSPYSSSYGGYGGGMGSYGSSYGGMGSYGSSYGGYGGYGSSYGGMGGMGGYGRMGMMGGPQDQKGFLFNTMITLQSFGYLIQTLCQIGRSIDQNCEGLQMFYASFKNLLKKFQSGTINGFKWMGRKIRNFFLAIYNFIVENLFFQKQKNLRKKFKVIKYILTFAVVLLAISMYPIIESKINAPIK